MCVGCARGLLAPHQRAAHALCRLKCFVEKIASNVHSTPTSHQAPCSREAPGDAPVLVLPRIFLGEDITNQIKHEQTKRSTGLPDVNE